jgi:hypothetical protein
MQHRFFRFFWEVNQPAGYCWVEVEASEPLIVDLPVDEPEELEEPCEVVPGPDIEVVPGPDIKVPLIGKSISDEQALSLSQTNPNKLMLVEYPPHGGSDQTDLRVRYDPLDDHTGLFRTFAETTVTPSSIKAFACNYGFQFEQNLEELGWFTLTVPEIYGEDTPIYGEPFGSWRNNILLMCEALSMWDMARQKDVRGLARYLQWRQGELLLRGDVRILEKEPTVIDSIRRSSHERIGFSEGDLIEPAKYVAGVFVNTEMDGQVSPGLLWDRTGFSHHLAILPQSLVGALWLQFARAIDGNRDYRACPNCGTWFEVGQGAASRARRFCSNKCRVAFSRKLQKQTVGENP